MKLSTETISKFVKTINNDKPRVKTPALAYGTAYRHVDEKTGEVTYSVRLDGSDYPDNIPVDISQIASGVYISDGSSGTRVVLTMSNHSVSIISSLEAPGKDLTALAGVTKSVNNCLMLDVHGLTIGDMTTGVLKNNLLIDNSSVKIRNGSIVNSIFGANLIELAKNNESATISMLNGSFKIYYDKTSSDGGFGVYGKAPDGSDRLAFQPVNEHGNTILGWGNYAAHSGNTNVYGNDIHLGVSYNNTINKTFRPYYRKGDSFPVIFRGAGYITAGGMELRFSIPVSKPIIGNPTISVVSNGFTLRQNGKYTHGCTDSEKTHPTTISASSDENGNTIYVDAKFSDVTNAVNNDAIGIYWEGTITFK